MNLRDWLIQKMTAEGVRVQNPTEINGVRYRDRWGEWHHFTRDEFGAVAVNVDVTEVADTVKDRLIIDVGKDDGERFWLGWDGDEFVRVAGSGAEFVLTPNHLRGTTP